MKKILVLCFALVLVVGMSVNVFATPNRFVSSPSGNSAPGLVSFVPSDEQCTAKLIITPYGDRNDLSNAIIAMLEKAYDGIANSDDLTKLNADLAKLAKDKGIDAADLAVSDLFDIHVTGCDYHDGHTEFDITLSADTLNRFVGLLHMNRDGVWELVSDAKVISNGEHLKFSVESFSPFAIVVDTNVKGDTPKTGDDGMIYVYAAVMAASALAVIFIVVKRRKQTV